jgi:chemosensory pili system protein ChpA (sensor histidine kinase/response regulator)
MLALATPAKLLAALQQTIERYLAGDNPSATEMHDVAAAVSALDAYVHDLTQGQKSDSSALEGLIAALYIEHPPSEAAVAQAVVEMPTGVSVREGGEDDELLEVFLEEANEVLETLHANLEACQSDANNREALITIRRGFHTLKGSGRMVGLTNLGEVAWALERAMNKWLQEEMPATPALLEMIGDAEVLFQHWVDRLRSGGSALIDTVALLAAAQRIESGTEEAAEAAPAPQAALTVAPTQPKAVAENLPELELPAQMPKEAAQEEENEEEEEEEEEEETQAVMIGEVSISPMLFKIATEEAAGNVEALQRQAAALHEAESPIATYDSMRAAHTLAGINRTMGIKQIAELASALEQWLQTNLDGQVVLDAAQLALFDETIGGLDEMNRSLRSRQAPQAQTGLIARLQASKPALPVVIADEGLSLQLEGTGTELGLLDFGMQPATTASVQEEALEWMPEPVQFAPQETSQALTLQTEELLLPDMSAAAQPDLQADVPNELAQSSADLQLTDTMAEALLGLRLDDEMANFGLPDESATPTAEETRAGEQPQAAEFAGFMLDFDALNIPPSPEPESRVDDVNEQPGEAALDVLLPAPVELAESAAPAPSPGAGEQFEAEAEAQAGAEQVDPDINLVSYAEYLAQQERITQESQEMALAPADEVAAQPAPAVEAADTAQLQELIAAAHEEEELAHAQQAAKQRTVHDDLDEQLLPIFLEEADELYPQISNEMRAWRAQPEGTADAQKFARNLQRSLHTLKGSARMAGAMRLGELTHRVEDCLAKTVADGRQDTAQLDELDNYFDRIANALEQLRRGEAMEELAPEAATRAVAEKALAPLQETAAMAPIQKVAQHLAAAQPEQQAEVVEERGGSAMLRVRSDVVDNLVNEAGEISVARSRIEIELRAFRDGLLELTDSVNNLRKLVREIEIHAEGQMQARVTVAGDSAEKFDPLEFDRFTRFQELTRFMNEGVHDVQTVQQTLLKNMDETAAAMSAQALMNRELQQNLMSIRMLPFASISQRLYRIVRQTGKDLNKKVNLDLRGSEVELDRSVLEKMTAPFEHLLRNAIVHGLEDAAQREASGKPLVGNITLSLRQEGNEVVFEFADDGAGLNLARLRQKGLEKGVIQQNEPVSDEQLRQLIFASGLSTATELTEVAGRGVGMDVVRSEISGLGGRIDVYSETGKGTRFVIYLPLTLAVMKTLTVRAVQQTYAIPAVMVEQVQQVKPAALEVLYREGKVEWQGRNYPLHYLPSLLGDYEHMPEIQPYNAVLLLRSGEQRMALHLDELLGNQEVVVKNIGPQLARLPGIAGATVLGDGKVVLIINPVPLLQQVEGMLHQEPGTAAVAEPVHKIPVVMVVDDSLTVRKITTRLLSRAGYQVVTAKDGMDALEQLVDMTPDLMLLDVEMPRMDGFELTKQLRRDAKTLHMPIIMITSRTADKHRNFALELGVDEYMGKPYQEEELLEQIARLLAISGQETQPA